MILIYLILLTTVTVAIDIDDIDHNTMVLFKRDSCPYCSDLQPTWDELKINYKIYTIDCEEHENYCKMRDIDKFPTILYKINDRWEKYEHENDMKTLTHFLDTYIVDGCLQNETLCDENEISYMNYLLESDTDKLQEMIENHNNKITKIQTYFMDEREKLRDEYKLILNNRTRLVLEEKKNVSYVLTEINKRGV